MSEKNTIQEEMWHPSINPWLMIIPVILSVFMFALDETVSNVALVYISGSFSASQIPYPFQHCITHRLQMPPDCRILLKI